MPEPITLDLTKQENAAYIKLLLQQYPTTKQFCCRDSYTLEHEGGQVTVILQQTLLHFEKPSDSRKPEKAAIGWHYYAVIDGQNLGEGSFGQVRPVLGVWKICSDRIEFKKKSDPGKERLLKSCFFAKAIELSLKNAGYSNVLPPSEVYNYYEQRLKQDLSFRLNYEQKLSSFTPHMSTKYPIIVTGDGVHLLMRQQKGCTLHQLLTQLKVAPQRLSFIQRQLLCIDLYQTLEREAHSVRVTDHANSHIIHRDLKPKNIIVSINEYSLNSHLIDYGLSTHSNTQRQTLEGSPQYMAPDLITSYRKPLAADDLFALALICAEIWGDDRRYRITSKRVLISENKDIRFDNLFHGMRDVTQQQQECIIKLLYQTTRERIADRWTKIESLEYQTKMLIASYDQLTASHPQLNGRLTSLKKGLKAYNSLRLDDRQQLDREFIAAECLLKSPAFLANYSLNEDYSLADSWITYCNMQLKLIVDSQLPCDSPLMLMQFLQQLQRQCSEPLRPNGYVLNNMLGHLNSINSLSALFQRLKFIEHTVIRNTFNEHINPLSPNYLNLMQQYLINALKHKLNALLIDENIPQKYQKRFIDLCNMALLPSSCSDQALAREWKSARRFLSLNYELKERMQNQCIFTLFLASHHSFSQALTLLTWYKQRLNHKKNLSIISSRLNADNGWSPTYFQVKKHAHVEAIVSQYQQHPDTETSQSITNCATMFDV
ncbi:MAG: protein kinase domain-containing protein [Legionella sp.]